MKGDPLPDDDSVVHYIRPTSRDGEEINGAFKRRRKEETGLSVNWLDYFRNQPKKQQLKEVRQLFRLKVRPKGCFAEFNVGQTRRYLAEEIENLRFVEDPLDPDSNNCHDADPSHALIEGLPDPFDPPGYAEMIGDMIAKCVLKPLHPAIEE